VSLFVDSRIGSELLGYRIEALLGRGGMSVVYRAEDLRLKRKVALKLLAPELAADERFRERFLRESELAASLDHPSIVPIYEAGEVEGQLYIAMRYVAGGDFKALLREEGSLEPTRALSLLAQVADALDAAHDAGLVHRDVKPGNVLLDSREHCYLSDFGLTKQVSSESGFTATGEITGTIEYVAPEVIEGKKIDARADLYSLGCMLFECLAGEPPFHRDSELAVLWAHVHEEPAKLSDRRPELGEELDAVLAKALAKAPEKRHARCRELVEAARQALPEPEPAAARPGPGRRLLLGALALAVAVLATVLSLVFTGGSESGQRAQPAPAIPSAQPAPAAPSPEPPPAPASPVAPPTLAITTESIQRIDPRTNELVATIPVGTSYPGGLAVGGGSVWAADSNRNVIYRIDPRTNAVTRISGGGAPTGLAFGGGSLWVLDTVDNTVAELDPASGVTLHTIGLPAGYAKGGIAADADQVWVTEATADGNLTFVDPLSRAVRTFLVARRGHPNISFTDIALGQGALWVSGHDPQDPSTAGVSKVDPRTGKLLASVRVEGCGGCAGTAAQLAVGEEGVWVAQAAVAVVRIASSGKRVARVARAGSGVDAVAVGAGSVWVASTVDGTVSRIDPATGDVLATIPVGMNPSELVVDENGVWVAVRP